MNKTEEKKKKPAHAGFGEQAGEWQGVCVAD